MAAEALTRPETRLDLGRIEPTPMLWCVVDRKPTPQGLARFGAEGGAQRVLGVGIEIIHDEMNRLRRWIAGRDPAERSGELLRGTVLRGVRHVPPGLGLDDAEYIGCAAPDVLVVLTCDAPGRRCPTWASRIPQDDWSLIERDDRLGHVQRLRQGVEQIVHPCHVLLVQLWNAPHFFPATA